MKNRVVCLVLCIISLAASMMLLLNVINSDAPVVNVLKKEDTSKAPQISVENPSSKPVELSVEGIKGFALQIEGFFNRMAYESDKSTYEAQYIIDNCAPVAAWLRENSKAGEAAFYEGLSLNLGKAVTGFGTDANFSSSVSAYLKSLDSAYLNLSDTTLCPSLNTEVDGNVTLAFLSLHNKALQNVRGSSSYTVTVGGSALLGDKLSTMNYFKGEAEKSSYPFPFHKISPFFATDDLSLVTLLAPLTDSSDSESGVLDPVKGSPSYAASLAGMVEGVSLACDEELNNYGETGFNDTVKALEKNSVTYSVNGGLAALDTEFGRVVYIAFDLTGLPVTAEQNRINRTVIANNVKTAKEDGADLVIVLLNWDTRLRAANNSNYVGQQISLYEPHFDVYNKDIAQAAIDEGADLVVGTGAHLVQGIKKYRGKYIVHCVGDLTWSAGLDKDEADTEYSFLFEQTFTRENGAVVAQDVRIIPIVNTSENEPLLPTPVFDERADEIIGIINSESRYFSGDAIKDYSYIKITK